jgi:hypothetical protein
MKDTARVLGRMYDGIEYRGYGQKIVEELGKKRRTNDIIQNLGSAGLGREQEGISRIVIEKPFGRDLDSARRLNGVVHISRRASTASTTPGEERSRISRFRSRIPSSNRLEQDTSITFR